MISARGLDERTAIITLQRIDFLEDPAGAGLFPLDCCAGRVLSVTG